MYLVVKKQLTSLFLFVINFLEKYIFNFCGSNLYQNVVEATGCHIFV